MRASGKAVRFPSLRRSICRRQPASTRRGFIVPAKQSEQPWPPQQDQALQPGGGRVKGQVIGPAKADPLLQLHHLFFTQFPDGQCPSPLSATAYAAAGHIMQKAVETAWQIVVYCGQSIP